MKQASQRRVQAVVALKLLEVIRDRDLPGELLEDEDPAQTIPRRFGLSEVVERQIRTFREDARRGGKLSDREIGDLFRLVIRRPDSDKVFHEAGRLLASEDATGRWPRALPTKARFSVARSRVGKRLRKLFGRPVGGFEAGPFVLEAREHFLIDTDPGGDACHLVSGLCRQVLAHTIGGAPVVAHTDCRAAGDEVCRWEGVLEAPPATVDLVEERPDLDEPDVEGIGAAPGEAAILVRERAAPAVADPTVADERAASSVVDATAVPSVVDETAAPSVADETAADASPANLSGRDPTVPGEGAAGEAVPSFDGAGILMRDATDVRETPDELDAGASGEAPRIP